MYFRDYEDYLKWESTDEEESLDEQLDQADDYQQNELDNRQEVQDGL